MTTQEAIDYLLDQIGKREQHNEAARMAVRAMQKQIPKPVAKSPNPYFKWCCPTCGYYPVTRRCEHCGQKIDWGDGNDE